MYHGTDNLILFIIAALTLNLTPGPDILFVITPSVAEGKKSGIASSLGIATGSLVHTALIAFGLSSLLLAVPNAYEIIKYAGAAYLVYLGIKIIFTKQKLGEKIETKKTGISSVFWQGMVTNMLNPKVALFFLAFLPQFIDPAGNITLQIIFLALLFNLSGTTVNIIVALTASRLGKLLKRRLNNSSIFKWINGSVFIGLGIRLALLERK